MEIGLCGAGERWSRAERPSGPWAVRVESRGSTDFGWEQGKDATIK